MAEPTTLVSPNLDICVDAILRRVGRRIVLGTPLALGKPNHLLNALYRRAQADQTTQLVILTGLSLARPPMRSELEKRFLAPILERTFGDAPNLDYVGDYMADRLPPNVAISEFFLNTGKLLGRRHAQQHYLSSNYTCVARDMMIQGCNVFAQAVSQRTIDGEIMLSVSSNSDSLDLHPLLRDAGRTTALVAQVNRRLPFMHRDAMVPPSQFDIVLDDPLLDHDLLSPPNGPVSLADHAIGLNATALIKDGGTLQIGIGSLGDAIAAACCLRQRDPATFAQALDALGTSQLAGDLIECEGGIGPFTKGLYGSTEMFCDGYRHLYEAGILKRQVFDEPEIQGLLNQGAITLDVSLATLDVLAAHKIVPVSLDEEGFKKLVSFGVFRKELRFEDGSIIMPDGSRCVADLDNTETRQLLERKGLGEALAGGTILHAGFFLGPRGLYQMLSELDDVSHQKFCMTGIRYVNELFGHEPIAKLQRQQARFMNSTMMATLLGAVCSDGLEDGQVVSGVGGQYNFVAQAHALNGARSILMLRSTRKKGQNLHSNIVWNYGHVTIPRHLRDIVVTEYGIADLRGQQDREVIARMLAIADSRFQEGLREEAVRAGKLPSSFQIPEQHRANLPGRLSDALAPFRRHGHFATFPFGTDLTEEEQVLGRILSGLKSRMGKRMGALGVVAGAAKAVGAVPEAARPYLERLDLDRPSGVKERMLQRVIVAGLKSAGKI